MREPITKERTAVDLEAEVQQLREDLALSAWRASSARGALHRVVGMIPSGALRNRVAELVADVDQKLYPPREVSHVH